MRGEKCNMPSGKNKTREEKCNMPSGKSKMREEKLDMPSGKNKTREVSGTSRAFCCKTGKENVKIRVRSVQSVFYNHKSAHG